MPDEARPLTDPEVLAVLEIVEASTGDPRQLISAIAARLGISSLNAGLLFTSIGNAGHFEIVPNSSLMQCRLTVHGTATLIALRG
jgi:hypothetical protein